MRSKIKTYIENLDKLLYGGIPEYNQIVLAGCPGTGKTLMSFEFLYHNAKEGHTGIYLSTEENTQMIIENAKTAFTTFEDIDQLISDKKLIVQGRETNIQYIQRGIEGSSYSYGKWTANIQSLINQYKADRVVIDSISAVKAIIKDPYEYRALALDLVTLLRSLNTTSIIVDELQKPGKEDLSFQPEFFMYDGIIALYLSEEGGKRTMSLEVIKMRGTAHSFDTVPYSITPKGILLSSLPEKQV